MREGGTKRKNYGKRRLNSKFFTVKEVLLKKLKVLIFQTVGCEEEILSIVSTLSH